MKKYFLSIILSLAGLLYMNGQTPALIVEGESGNLFLSHSVSAKETWYGIGRIYNLPPREIASFNGVTIDKPLAIGEMIKIPLTAHNFSQDGLKANNEVFVPLYHIIKDKEWLYRISMNHNKVPIETLERWNNISKDDAKAGMKLIVGYLKVRQNQSSLASMALDKVEARTIAHEEPKETSTVKKEEIKTTEDSRKPQIIEAKNSTTSIFNGGYFRTSYHDNGKFASGISGVFKSTSGWKDGKYYALMNNVPVGTIVQVNGTANKMIFAKVLGQLPEMKESMGLTIRISDAAATELGASNSKFSVDVRY